MMLSPEQVDAVGGSHHGQAAQVVLREKFVGAHGYLLESRASPHVPRMAYSPVYRPAVIVATRRRLLIGDKTLDKSCFSGE